MCREYKLACLNWCCQLLHCFDGELNLVCSWKMFIMWERNNMEAWNQVSRDLETQPSRNLCVLVHRVAGSCNQQQKSSYSNNCVKVIVLSDFCGCNGRTSTICQQWSRLSSPSKQGSYSATDGTSSHKQTCTHDTLWRPYYLTTNKEHLINSHILLKYFKLVFFQLQLVKMSCTLTIIWVNYKKEASCATREIASS